jgi:hypothetical protein
LPLCADWAAARLALGAAAADWVKAGAAAKARAVMSVFMLRLHVEEVDCASAGRPIGRRLQSSFACGHLIGKSIVGAPPLMRLIIAPFHSSIHGKVFGSRVCQDLHKRGPSGLVAGLVRNA